MIIVVLFIALACLCCGIAASCGGPEGRYAGGLMLLALTIGRVSGVLDLSMATSPAFKLVLDGCLLMAFLAIMIFSRRWWPIWIVGFQFNGVLAHFAALVAPHYTPLIYRGLESFWGIPIAVAMAVGAALDRAAAIPSEFHPRLYAGEKS
ncbi:hypothetical protein [Sphingomonas aerolata]|uniref:hypothetical protein n=1 Tax=Sphingomonas aerolata TaxID=185951 RepID=UPI00141B29B2|nr:hypothetical protein [Sphingomonas aerolata]NII59766.1 hypothetical protein [Sphingomonas aerolata]